MRCRLPSVSALTLLVLTALPAPSRADQSTPYNGSFGLTLTSVKPLPKGGDQIKGVIAGEATFLGPFTGTVEYHVFPDGSFVGTATKLAADGDQLRERLAGTLTATGSVGAFVVTGGTRRFKDASGSGTFVSTWTSATTAAVTFAGSASYHPQPLPFHVSGNGVFNPANIGTPKGGNAGLVLGDGSGLAPYTASGTDFVLGQSNLGASGLGSNDHVGAAQSSTKGTLANGMITWPVVVGPNPDPPKKGDKRVHVTHTLLGDIHFSYAGEFILNPATGVITGLANFVVTGGTRLFENADGSVFVKVVSTGSEPSGGVDFHYEFDGLITVDE